MIYVQRSGREWCSVIWGTSQMKRNLNIWHTYLVCGSRHSRRLRAFRRLHLGPGCWHGASIEFLPFKGAASKTAMRPRYRRC